MSIHLAVIAKYCLFIFGIVTTLNTHTFANDKTKDIIEIVGEKTSFTTNYTLLKRDDFLGRNTNLSDILQKQAGIQIRQVGGLGNQVSISIRGSTDKQVQFYIDGQLINSGQFGSFDLNQLPLDQIQSIEISKSQAVGTGITPIGGVIKINTFDPEKAQTRFSGSIGSFDMADFSILKSTHLNAHQISANLSYLTTSNNYPYLVNTPLNSPNNPQVENLRNNDYQKINAYLNDSFVMGNHKIKASLQFIEQNKNLPRYNNNSDKNRASLDTYTRRMNISDDWLLGNGYFESLYFELNAESKNEIFLNKFESDTSTHERHDYQTNSGSINLSTLLNIGEISITPYSKTSYSEFQSQSTSGKKGEGCSGSNGCDIIAEQTQYHLGSRFEVESDAWAGHILINQLWDSSRNKINQLTSYPFVHKHSNYSYFTFDSSVRYQINSSQQASLNAAKGVRIPTLFERYGDRGMFKGNDDLMPEESQTLALSYDYATKDWQFTPSIYLTEQENAIVAIFNTSGVGSYENIAKSTIMGVELITHYSLSNNLDLAFNLALIDSNTQSDKTQFNNKMLPGIYHQQYQAELNYKINQLTTLSLSASHEQDLYFSRANILTEKGKAERTLVDFNANYKFGNWRIAFQALNLFDKTYQDLANRPAIGRSFKLSFTFEDIN
ncbi:hypothetical protein DS2_11758 [Catenovulum agarivorans DS-2]|uniref:TonB-dependent receptor n=1 Tax=Catenovulum agarivorans DS-2 TaxID=1328313 RepID=W7QL41_9ALTE|nr:TonB-dependent receptor [Catenovulum agarivorans]EWH09642.1 hypothetical protein DS2_11758 [Catenovulum agarivorans DS-2]